MSQACSLRCDRCDVPHAAHPESNKYAMTWFEWVSGRTLCCVCLDYLEKEA